MLWTVFTGCTIIPMSTAAIKFHKSKDVPNRLRADNGLDILDDAGYLSAAVDKDHDGEGYWLRIWTGRKVGSPAFTYSFEKQSEAKAVAMAVLVASLEEGDYDLSSWIYVSFHKIYRTAIDALWAAEDAKLASKSIS